VKRRVLTRLKQEGWGLSLKGLEVRGKVDSGVFRIGFLSVHQAGPATKRNRWKRLIREFWRRSGLKGDFVFVFKKEMASLPERELRLSLQKAGEFFSRPRASQEGQTR